MVHCDVNFKFAGKSIFFSKALKVLLLQRHSRIWFVVVLQNIFYLGQDFFMFLLMCFSRHT